MSSIEEFDNKYGDNIGFSYKVGEFKPKRILLSTGILPLDLATGVGGVWTGGVMELMGAFGTGKSSIAYNILADGVSKGMSGMVIDSEGGHNEEILLDILEDHGVDVSSPKKLPVRYIPPTALEDMATEKGEMVSTDKKPVVTLERLVPMVEDYLSLSKNGAVVIIDSLDFTLNDDNVGSKVDTPTVALMARRLKNWLKRITGTLLKGGHLLIFVHQVSSKIDSYGGYDTDVFTGGNALKHASGFSARLKKIGQEKVGDAIVGENVRVSILKNKRGLAYTTCEYTIRSGVGPDDLGAVFEIAKKMKIIKVSGSWIFIPKAEGGEPVQKQGKEQTRQHWQQDRSNFQYIRSLILEKASGRSVQISETDE